MAVMVHPALPAEWTVADLETMPDDGCRYELVDGMLLVTPPPLIPHQVAAYRLAVILDQVMPRELVLIPGPAQVTHGDRTSFEPDLSVARRSDVGDGKLIAPPLLVVEILSRSTRSKDRVLKRSVYAEMGIPSYWIVDPNEPSVLILEIEGTEYVERVHALGSEPVAVTQPVSVTFSPSQLQDDLDNG